MTNNKVGINGRMILVVLLFIILIVAICTVLGITTNTFYAGPARAHVVATRTQKVMDVTDTKISIDQTQTAMPTITITPTMTPTQTPTATATVAAPIVHCPAKVISVTHVNMYAVPGGGRGGNVALVRTGSTVDVIGTLDDHAWYQIIDQGTKGWIRADYLSLQNGCSPNTYDLAYLFGLLADGKQPILQDTFSSNKSSWVDVKGAIIYPVEESEPDDYKLVLNSPYDLMTARWQDAPTNLKTFELTTSWSIIPNDIPAYVAFRFLINGPDYYEARILRDCSVELYETGKFFNKHIFKAGDNTCADNRSDFVTLSLDASYKLTIQINDSEQWELQLEDPDGIYAKGSGLELVTYKAMTSFEFIIITTLK